jgi:hypothetical protein
VPLALGRRQWQAIGRRQRFASGRHGLATV